MKAVGAAAVAEVVAAAAVVTMMGGMVAGSGASRLRLRGRHRKRWAEAYGAGPGPACAYTPAFLVRISVGAVVVATNQWGKRDRFIGPLTPLRVVESECLLVAFPCPARFLRGRRR